MECHNHKPQPFPDPKRKRKPTNLNKHKPDKRTKSTKISSLFPKRGNRNTKRTEKHKNKMTHGKTCNKSPHRIYHKATKSKTNTGTTALNCKLRKIYACNDFSIQFRKTILRYIKIGYNINLIRQTACMAVNPISVNNFASLCSCTPAGPASHSKSVGA